MRAHNGSIFPGLWHILFSGSKQIVLVHSVRHNLTRLPSRLRKNSVYTQYADGTFRIGVDVNIASGCFKRPSSKAAGESKPEEVPARTSWGRSPIQWILANGKTPPALPPSEYLNRYVEDLNEARTPLADFFSILLEADEDSPGHPTL